MKKHLSNLDERTTKLIAVAEDVEEQAKLISFHMKFEWKNIDKEYNHAPLWKMVFVNRGWKGEMLKRDLTACRDTIGNITVFITGLRSVKTQLTYYREHIDNFKVLSI